MDKNEIVVKNKRFEVIMSPITKNNKKLLSYAYQVRMTHLLSNKEKVRKQELALESENHPQMSMHLAFILSFISGQTGILFKDNEAVSSISSLILLLILVLYFISQYRTNKAVELNKIARFVLRNCLDSEIMTMNHDLDMKTQIAQMNTDYIVEFIAESVRRLEELDPDWMKMGNTNKTQAINSINTFFNSLLDTFKIQREAFDELNNLHATIHRSIEKLNNFAVNSIQSGTFDRNEYMKILDELKGH